MPESVRYFSEMNDCWLDEFLYVNIDHFFILGSLSYKVWL